MRSGLLALVGCLLGSVCMANPPSFPGGDSGDRPEPPNFSQFDSDGDGYVSRSEAASIPPLKDHFDDIDSNGDGLLSEAEMESHRPEPPSGGPER